MATVVSSTATVLPIEWSAADLQSHLGGISLERIRMYPPPGMATEKDVVEAETRFDRICELIDGVLVEKVMASYESFLAAEIIFHLRLFLGTHDLGIVLGEAGFLKILPGQVRAPDVSFIRWEQLPGRAVPQQPIFALAPDLAVEVLSRGNTKGEIRRKLREYFAAGVRLVWYIDPRTRTARAYSAEEQFVEIGEDGVLSGGEVLPGLELSLSEVFARAAGQAGG